MSFEVKPSENLPYGTRVLLPQVKEVHNRLASGLVDRRTWNIVLDLYSRCPSEVCKRINWERVCNSEDKIELVLSLFIQIRFYLEKQGYLIKKSSFKKGSL